MEWEWGRGCLPSAPHVEMRIVQKLRHCRLYLSIKSRHLCCSQRTSALRPSCSTSLPAQSGLSTRLPDAAVAARLAVIRCKRKIWKKPNSQFADDSRKLFLSRNEGHRPPCHRRTGSRSGDVSPPTPSLGRKMCLPAIKRRTGTVRSPPLAPAMPRLRANVRVGLVLDVPYERVLLPTPGSSLTGMRVLARPQHASTCARNHIGEALTGC